MRRFLVMVACAVAAAAAGAPLWGPLPLAAQGQSAAKARPHPTTVQVQVSTDDTADADHEDSSADSGDNSDDDAPATVSKADGDSRTITIGRQFHPTRDATAPMAVNVSYGGGSMVVRPADQEWLYNVRMSYSPRSMTPAVHFDTAARTLRVGSSSINFGPGHDKSADLRLDLARGVPMDVKVEFGAGDVNMQFGGLSVRALSISTGASDATVAFDSPNAIDMDHLKLEVGAAGFKATGLGNARVRNITVAAGVGDVDLDFGGHWTSDIALDLSSALGAVHVHVPTGVVVDHPSSKVIVGSMDDNTDGATGAGSPQTPGGSLYHLRVHGTTAFGAIEFDRHVGAKD